MGKDALFYNSSKCVYSLGTLLQDLRCLSVHEHHQVLTQRGAQSRTECLPAEADDEPVVEEDSTPDEKEAD